MNTNQFIFDANQSSSLRETSSRETKALYAGIELCATHLRIAVLNQASDVVMRHEILLSNPDSVESIAQDSIELVRLAQNEIAGRAAQSDLSQNAVVAAKVAAIGIAIPGLVNTARQAVVMSTELPTLSGTDLSGIILNATKLPVILENDANAAAFAEYSIGAGRGSQNIFYVTIDYGIGGAIILNGELWRGASGFAGEFGYMSIEIDGTTLESVASAPSIVERTKNCLLQDTTSSLTKLSTSKDFTAIDIARAATQGDDFALMMLERIGKYIGTAVASVINLLNIERIIFGGGIVVEARELLLNSITRTAARRSFKPCFDATQFALAALGTDAAAIGAALLARNHTKTLT